MVYEIAIALFDSPSSVGTEEGDIVVCRPPLKGIGKKEGTGYLWFRVDISEVLGNVLTQKWTNESGELVKKRRYNIPLDKIKNLRPTFSFSNARNLEYQYQPLMEIDSKYLFVDSDPGTFALEILSVIKDKKIGEFI